jgi:prolyl 4-hydroxylase
LNDELTDCAESTMQYESLAPDLKSWLKSSIDQGFDRDSLEKSMRASGYQPKFARRAIELAFTQHAPEIEARVKAAQEAAAAARTEAAAAARTEVAASSAADAMPGHNEPQTSGPPPSTHEILAESPNAIETTDRKVDILFALNAPRIILFGGLLSDEECDQMIKLAEPKLTRSTVVNTATGSYDVHADRTSRGGHFQRGENELIRRVEARISNLVGFAVENGEPIQILHYVPGAEYKPHFDYFDPKLPGNEKVLAMGGQRVATLVMYLNDVEAGGSTVFPEVGIDVLPKKGNAVYFAYTTEDNQLDARSLHGGSPVQAGEKWIATKWIRQRQYGGPGA